MYRIEEIFTEEEFIELQLILGEHKRVTRDQVWRYVKGDYEQSSNIVSNQRFEITKKLLDKVSAAVKIT